MNAEAQKLRHASATDHDDRVTFIRERDEHVVVSRVFKDFLRSNQKYVLGRRVESLEHVIIRLLSDDSTAEYAAFKLTRESQDRAQAGPSLNAKPA